MTRVQYGAGKTGTPAFAERGIVEGFYGRPWTHEQRLDMIRFIGERGMNRFVYAPKDDPLMRREWARRYDDADLERIAALSDACVENKVDLVYCISPGLSIRYSSADDTEALVAKLASVAALGVRRFGLLLDDVPTRLQHPADISRFGSLAEAQRELADTVFTALRGIVPTATLVVCPTEYWGYGDEPYLVQLAEGLHPEIDLFWTGRAICSATIDVPDAERFAQATGRQPLYWDNYPVNDVAMGHELHVGPYRGRSPLLDGASRGVIANGMELFESSKIAFATIADFLWSPRDYDPEASWDVALRDVVGAADVDAYRDFADNVRSSCLSAARRSARDPGARGPRLRHPHRRPLARGGSSRSAGGATALVSRSPAQRSLRERGAHRGSPPVAGVLRPRRARTRDHRRPHVCRAGSTATARPSWRRSSPSSAPDIGGYSAMSWT